ncbi:anthranilate phosphoribosyltransferase [Picrophilus oshimae]|uniref:Anthranilate phosphoribosyltransferase n=1 Tax=Picrophilus torridus (strain ATCC 700027 / DSM 9790 / JCM 10055 / NBRC 100828 / KAW 2/3) TaxID=1122961 RepID=TRPD_PICTO|nr:anthranilate phosphoribosyltransferase [Picrophilus oshimae]Q6L273.1 RecName: Full=Anthranilate phosphoribosyltransferase [Picrophilus oshimae DSM 9789]AAT42929.1 anthranilate phosphoribosyltransferase [Picrophilus oshimae DSM 9789]
MLNLDFIYENRNMSESEAELCMINIIDAPDTVKAAFLTALYVKGITPDELSGFSRALRKLSSISINIDKLTDIVGTGGDHKNTINVSTAASILLSLRIKIAKHGNFGITGSHGSADFMKFIGYKFEMTEYDIIKNLNEKNYVYILAPVYNKTFAKFSNVRKKLGIKTVFNILGPLTNPLNPENLVIGAYDDETAETYASVMLKQNKRAFIVSSTMDEISPEAESHVYYVNNAIRKFDLDPLSITGKRINESNIIEKDPVKSFNIIIDAFKNKNRDAASFIALNAAPALVLNGISRDITSAYDLCINDIESGAAYERLRRISNED